MGKNSQPGCVEILSVSFEQEKSTLDFAGPTI
jgi:hypothetical protein